MIRMGLIGVMREDHSRAEAPQERDDRGARGLRIDQSAIPEIERFAAGRAEDCRRGKSFRGPLCHRPTRRRLPAREIDDAGRVSERGHPEERAAGVELDVVGMSADGEDIDGLGRLGALHGRKSTATPLSERDIWSRSWAVSPVHFDNVTFSNRGNPRRASNTLTS
jgi:hypothetical protein